MIKKLTLTSFKCFSSLEMLLAPITLLVGLNNSGKSSILQAIQICKHHKVLEGLGTDKDLKHRNSDSYPKINIEFEKNYFAKNHKDMSISIKFPVSVGKPSKLFDRVDYISADRFGPRVTLPFKNDCCHVGEFGENVYSSLSNYRSEGGVPSILRHESVPETSGVFEQVRAWLNIISPGIKFNFAIFEQADMSSGLFAESRATNVGFGLSYTLPIIVSPIISASRIATMKKGSVTLLIENPEAHLHPRGQTQLGYFLALASQCGVQTIVETHSEHILNGIRLAVKDKKVPDNDAIFYFFQKNAAEGISEATPIFIDKDGMLDSWPDGFFDEAEKTLMRLI
ncbi:MAG: AAA family ATPase [Candidatus Adiutrix sp.]